MDNPLIHTVKIGKAHTKFFTVSFKRRHLAFRHFILYLKTIDGRDVVVHCRKRVLGSSDLSSLLSQPFKCLRRRHLMNKMQINIEKIRFSLTMFYNMLIPNLFDDCSRHHLLFPPSTYELRPLNVSCHILEIVFSLIIAALTSSVMA